MVALSTTGTCTKNAIGLFIRVLYFQPYITYNLKIHPECFIRASTSYDLKRVLELYRIDGREDSLF